ncbi:hypothetical protein [Pseudomonas amygdali]|uniref:Uncharacterized protein n=1 Tax=Pseudomonas amygdali pv. lachrymans str. M301315 TaxID=629260 RepID=A0AAD0PVW2_PSEAV|nr:hypothetical protein [Pseudomonas amygdali]AXH59719.1 hypothetical protein PLA107_031345 [Pseudomonas amygdali pv. lachrymans str. M301315]
MKFPKFTVPFWAYLALLAMPPVLLTAMLFWVAGMANKTVATVQLLLKVSSAGLFTQPGVSDMAQQALQSGNSETVMVYSVLAVVFLNILVLAFSRPAPRTLTV